MEKTIKDSADYEINLSEKGYEFNYKQTSENELAALMITRELLKFSKENLKESLKQVKGKHLEMVKDRLGKITTSEYTLTMMIESVIGEFLVDEKEKVEQ